MNQNPSRKTPANQQPDAVPPDAERGSEATERQSPDRSAAGADSCSAIASTEKVEREAGAGGELLNKIARLERQKVMLQADYLDARTELDELVARREREAAVVKSVYAQHAAQIAQANDAHEQLEMVTNGILKELDSAKRVIAAARELYTAHKILMLGDDATEDDHFRAGIAARKLHEELAAFDAELAGRAAAAGSGDTRPTNLERPAPNEKALP